MTTVEFSICIAGVLAIAGMLIYTLRLRVIISKRDRAIEQGGDLLFKEREKSRNLLDRVHLLLNEDMKKGEVWRIQDRAGIYYVELYIDGVPFEFFEGTDKKGVKTIINSRF